MTNKFEGDVPPGEQFDDESNDKKSVEPEQALSVRDIKKQAEDLRAKVEAAKAQREKDVEQKLTDLETLIAEEKRNEELLATVQEALEYFTSMQELGEIKDRDDIKKLEEFKTLVASLEKQRLEIDKNISLIEGKPEVFEKLYDAATQEDVQRTVKKEFEQASKQLNLQIDQLAKSIKDLAEKIDSLWLQKERQKKEVLAAWNKISDSFARAKDVLREDKSQFGDTLNEVLIQARTPQEIQQRLSEIRKELGMFKGKEKAAVDFILSRTQEFEEYNQVNSNASALEQQLEATKAEEAVLSEQFKTIILNSLEPQNKIDELVGQARSNHLPFRLNFRLNHLMESFADIKRDEGGKQVGKYNGWRDEKHDSKNRTLRYIWENLEKRADVLSFMYENSKKTKEQK